MVLTQAACGSPDSEPMRELVDLPARYFEQASQCQPFQHAERTQQCRQQAEAAHARVPNLPFAQGQIAEGTRQDHCAALLGPRASDATPTAPACYPIASLP